ncbi:S9 family peptidase [Pontibacter sp. BT310]|uniref:S9 family peptidase n=1 Tax=Pontibacter populi TaxID=890055 RepID=A0ABS6X6P4_9BACT|nr:MULTISPECIES: S9 family peptidase [Pontibacter]MBJ6116807.1 S9 family peptidase [Pontibacter sp. BT310]MBR0569229.1 S9 family peptidase [Microvirga sp. STS03]MBW3363660.1 S9 family peptidase [Pontibacter populi]
MKKLKPAAAYVGTLLSASLVVGTGCSTSNTTTATNTTTEQMESTTTAEPKPPVAKKVPKELTAHGHTRTDNYYWLNERENPEVIAYLNAENDYTKKVMADTEQLQEKLFDEIVGRIKQTDESVPYKKNGYFYYTRFEAGKEYPIYARKKGTMEAAEEVMLNANQRAEGQSYYAAAGMNVSPNNNLLAFGEDTVSRRQYTIRFKNLQTGELLPDRILNTTGAAVWANDNKTVFYTMKDPSLRSFKIFRHTLGTPSSQDKEVYHETDETFSTFVYKTKSDKYIIIGSSSTMAQEYRFIDASNPTAALKVIQPRERGLEYDVDHFGDSFYIRTNKDGATNFKLMKTPVGKTTKENWKEVIAHRPDTYLEGTEIFKDYLVLQERKNGLTQLRIKKWNDPKTDYYVDFGEEAYTAGISINPDFDSKVLRYSYSSLTTPSSTYDYNMVTKEKTLLKEQEVVGDFDKNNYESKRVYATADDGTKIPISLVYRKGMKLDGNNPTLLYAYGSYGISMNPGFNSSRLSLLDRGFVYAIAHIRGGQEMGRQWYEDGKMMKKKNTFTDFIDASEYLIDQKYTNPDKLFAQGGSAGGLLMGAVVNMRPELYKGVHAAVPFVDVVTTMLDTSIPLTTGEFDEWGNPAEKAAYDYMLSYSPYDNVEAKAYPNMLVTTGLHDSQVQYFEPAKWVAKLREMKTDDNLLLLQTNMEAGHGGASGRFRPYRETALQYAFFLKLAGINE